MKSFILCLYFIIIIITKAEIPPFSIIHVSSLSDLPRASLTIASFVQNVDDNVIKDYILIVPKNALNHPLCQTEEQMKSITKFHIKCLDELEVLNAHRRHVGMYIKKPTKDDPASHNTWRLQMLLKIFTSYYITTEFLITVDSDTLLTQYVKDISWFLPYGKARVAYENRGIHASWYNASERLLHAKGCFNEMELSTPMIGVTPAILHTNTLLAVRHRLLRIHGRKARHPINGVMRATLGATGASSSWTEYSMYRVMGCLTGDFYSHHSYRLERNQHNNFSLSNIPRLYYGVWSEDQFLKIIQQNSGSSNSNNNKDHMHSKMHSMINENLFIILQDEQVKEDTVHMKIFLKKIFCPRIQMIEKQSQYLRKKIPQC